jgi:hypothetical protein
MAGTVEFEVAGRDPVAAVRGSFRREFGAAERLAGAATAP